MTQSHRFTRRAVLGGLAGMTLLPIATVHAGTPEATPSTYEKLQIDVGEGIVIVDVREIPNTSDSSWIVEFQNQRDDILDSPMIGVRIPNAIETESFAWVAPWDSVLPPGTSTFGVLKLPGAASGTEELEWMLCSPDVNAGRYTETLIGWDFDAHHNVELISANALRVSSEIRNNGDARIALGAVRGTVRDSTGRICGGTPITSPFSIPPGDSILRTSGFNDTWDSLVNPFAFDITTDQMEITFSVQPRGDVIPQGCPAVMPWNR